LADDYQRLVVVPLERLAGGAKIYDVGPALVAVRFGVLIKESQMWYNLLLEIGFIAGEILPYSHDFPLPDMTPVAHASKGILGHTSTMLVTIDGKIQDDDASRMAKVEQDKQKDAARADRLALKAEKERLEKANAQDKAAVEQRQRFDEMYQERLAVRRKEAERIEAEAAALKIRFEEFKELHERLVHVTEIGDDDLAKLQGFLEDPDFADLLAGPKATGIAGFNTTNVAAMINRIQHANRINQLTASQSKPGPKAFQPSGSKKSGKSRATISDVIDITHSDDDYDMGERMVMQQQLQQIPWQTYGLPPALIAPAINAIKGMEGKDKDLFSDDMSVKEIFRLGLKALKKKQDATGGESSVASDSSNKRSRSKPAAKRLQPRKKIRRMVSSEESEESDSVGSSKYVGKAPQHGRRHRPTQLGPPIYTDDGEDDEAQPASANAPDAQIDSMIDEVWQSLYSIQFDVDFVPQLIDQDWYNVQWTDVFDNCC